MDWVMDNDAKFKANVVGTENGYHVEVATYDEYIVDTTDLDTVDALKEYLIQYGIEYNPDPVAIQSEDEVEVKVEDKEKIEEEPSIVDVKEPEILKVFIVEPDDFDAFMAGCLKWKNESEEQAAAWDRAVKTYAENSDYWNTIYEVDSLHHKNPYYAILANAKRDLEDGAATTEEAKVIEKEDEDGAKVEETIEEKKEDITSHWKDQSALHLKAWEYAEEKVKSMYDLEVLDGKIPYPYAAVMAIAKSKLAKLVKEAQASVEEE